MITFFSSPSITVGNWNNNPQNNNLQNSIGIIILKYLNGGNSVNSEFCILSLCNKTTSKMYPSKFCIKNRLLFKFLTFQFACVQIKFCTGAYF